MTQGSYMDLIHCRTPEEVYATVRDWISGLTDNEHLVRSTILAIHADVERVMKETLYQTLLGIVFHGDEESEYEKHKANLKKTVAKLSFSTVHRVLKPCFNAYPADELADIQGVSEVRNAVVHRQETNGVTYKGRSPFNDPDCLAQLYLDAWAIRTVIGKFLEVLISDPRVHAKHYAEFYHESHARLKDEDASSPRISGRNT